MEFSGLERFLLNLSRIDFTGWSIHFRPYFMRFKTHDYRNYLFQVVCPFQRSLTVVGDDDQSIFRFRGATVELFANFNSELPRRSELGGPLSGLTYFRTTYRRKSGLVLQSLRATR